MKIEYKDYITRDYIKNNPDKYFLFGDNLQKSGFGGQAKQCRGQPNAIGIPTKKKPSSTEDSFFTDTEFRSNIKYIRKAFESIPKDAKIIVIPWMGLGTGLAELPLRAPDTYTYLQYRLSLIINDNQQLIEGSMCPYCNKNELVYIPEHQPHYNSHLQCPNCNYSQSI